MLKHYLLSIALIAGFASANANGIGVRLRLNHDNKTAIITGFIPEYTSGVAELPATTANSEGEKYTVIGVEPHALDNMTEVTKIIIPGTYTQLGNITASSQNVSKMPENGAAFLLNCPMLSSIEISGTSSIVKTTGAGILVSYDAKDTYLVPPRMEVSGNSLTLSSSCTRIGAGAFNLNTGIATLIFPSGLEYVAPDAGFHLMHQITTYGISGSNSTFIIYNGALVNKLTHTLVSLPKYYDRTSYYIDYTYTQNIGAYAFANNANVVSYTIPAPIEKIGNYSFSGSCISQVTLYPNINLSAGGVGAFSNCPRLTSINIKGEDAEIPADFASDCRELTKVTFDAGRPAGVGARAFRNCNKLTEFPFAGDIQWRGDSIFANTGFSEVVFEGSVSTRQDTPSTGLFAGCKYLRKLDLKGITFIFGNTEVPISDNYASDCPALQEILLPSQVKFSGTPFRNANALKKIVMSNYTRTQKEIISVSGNNNYNISVYLTVPYGAEMTQSPVSGLVSYNDGATGTTKIYTASFYCPFYADESDSHNTFFIPGESSQNYPDWVKGTEMFSFSAVGDENGVELTCVPKISNVVMNKVRFGYGETVDFNGGTVAKTSAPVSSVNNMLLYYTVDDVEMTTTYPASKITGIESINSNEALKIELKSKNIYFGATANFSIYTTAGTLVISGHDESVSIDSLNAGVYVVTASDGDHMISIKIAL